MLSHGTLLAGRIGPSSEVFPQPGNMHLIVQQMEHRHAKCPGGSIYTRENDCLALIEQPIDLLLSRRNIGICQGTDDDDQVGPTFLLRRALQNTHDLTLVLLPSRNHEPEIGIQPAENWQRQVLDGRRLEGQETRDVVEVQQCR